MLDSNDEPLLRNFVHVENLCEVMIPFLENSKAHQEWYSICMDQPVNYRKIAEYLNQTQNLSCLDLKTQYHSIWLYNTKAKLKLNWRPRYDLSKQIDSAWSYNRAPSDQRKIWYPSWAIVQKKVLKNE